MIIEALIIVLMTVLQVVLSVIPDLPPMPGDVTVYIDYVSNMFISGAGWVIHLYTPALSIAIFSMVIALLFFRQVWHITMFILRKLRITH